MAGRTQLGLAGLAVLLTTALAAPAYERELSSREIREAYFLGVDTTFRSEKFFEGYVKKFPRPPRGPYIERIEIVTPFKAVVDRARHAPGSYSPLHAESDYREYRPPVVVKVRIELTPTYPAHSPYRFPIHLGPIYLRDENFWKEFKYSVAQQDELTPLYYGADPFYSCPSDGGCWLAGADVTLVFNPEDVASRPTTIVVETPDGQRLEAEFDLGKLR